MTAPPCAAGCKRPSPSAVICAECTAQLGRELTMAASIAGDLDDAAARLMTRGGGGRASSEVPLPFDVEASEARRGLRGELYRWVRLLWVAPEPWPEPDIAPAARWLGLCLPRLRQHKDAGEAHRGILAAVQRAVRAVDRLPERVPAGTCTGCGAQLLAELGADEVTCSCGMLTSNLVSKRRERAAAADVLGTPDELSAILGTVGYKVTPATISSWGTRGQIERRAAGMYRLSDALDMAARMGTRRPRVGG